MNQIINPDWDIPTGLSVKATKAAEIIRAFASEYDLMFTGGCHIFVNPTEWRSRTAWPSAQYGGNSLLIVLHEGTASDVCLSLDGAYDRGSYDLYEALSKKLRGVGVYLEQCTRCYSALYEI